MKSLSNHRTSEDENGDDAERAKPILQVVELITSLDMIVTFPCAGVQREYDFSDLYYHVYILYIYGEDDFQSKMVVTRGGGGFGRERNSTIEKNVFALFPACTNIFFLLFIFFPTFSFVLLNFLRSKGL